jgi:hypothetical protein
MSQTDEKRGKYEMRKKERNNPDDRHIGPDVILEKKKETGTTGMDGWMGIVMRVKCLCWGVDLGSGPLKFEARYPHSAKRFVAGDGVGGGSRGLAEGAIFIFARERGAPGGGALTITIITRSHHAVFGFCALKQLDLTPKYWGVAPQLPGEWFYGAIHRAHCR